MRCNSKASPSRPPALNSLPPCGRFAPASRPPSRSAAPTSPASSCCRRISSAGRKAPRRRPDRHSSPGTEPALPGLSRVNGSPSAASLPYRFANTAAMDAIQEGVTDDAGLQNHRGAAVPDRFVGSLRSKRASHLQQQERLRQRGSQSIPGMRERT